MSHLEATSVRGLPPQLHVVPDAWDVRPLGEGVLAPEAPLDQDVVCRRVLPVTHDVSTIVLEPTTPGGVAFTPGQYLTLTAQVDGVPVERCYTISSPPTRPHLLTITVKRMPDGVLSPWLHDRLRPGDRLRVRGPLGSFSVCEHPAASYLLMSAGSGITPTLSTLRTAADLAEPIDVTVVHSARSDRDLACRAELDALGEQLPGLRVRWVPEDTWGRLHTEMLRALVPDAAAREVFVCGPEGYRTQVRRLLTELGCDPVRCHEESFVLGSPDAPAPPPAAPDGEAAGAVGTAPVVRFARSGKEVSCPPGTTVLEAARRAGVPLPSSCAEGLCGTCTSTLLSGQVDMHHQGGIRPRDVRAGKFLPCCSTPQGDLEVDA